jgi:hypothetical protein
VICGPGPTGKGPRGSLDIRGECKWPPSGPTTDRWIEAQNGKKKDVPYSPRNMDKTGKLAESHDSCTRTQQKWAMGVGHHGCMHAASWVANCSPVDIIAKNGERKRCRRNIDETGKPVESHDLWTRTHPKGPRKSSDIRGVSTRPPGGPTTGL